VARQESQDVCFIRTGSYGDFLAEQRGFEGKPGLIEDLDGRVIGKHLGLHLFTVGQRRGIGCPAAEPYYVARLDVERNRLIVGFKKDLPTAVFDVSGVHWIHARPEESLRLRVRVRYRSQAVPADVTPLGEKTARVCLASAQAGITPGQAAVFYRSTEVLGGGWIQPPSERS
jgi:tRNA-specific 2-thiouridylase